MLRGDREIVAGVDQDLTQKLDRAVLTRVEMSSRLLRTLNTGFAF